MPSTHRIIWNKLLVNRSDIVPYQPTTGLNKDKTERTTLYEIMNEANLKIGVEVGVDRGINAANMFKTISGLKLFCVDPWKPYRQNGTRPIPRHMEGRYQDTVNRLKGCNVEFMRMASLEAATKFKENSIDFVYIDGMHEFDPVMQDIIAWVPKVRPGGIVSGHDYYNSVRWCQVQAAVEAYTKAHHIELFYLVAVDRPKNGKDWDPASWFWVK